jgi:hypothetical protein
MQNCDLFLLLSSGRVDGQFNSRTAKRKHGANPLEGHAVRVAGKDSASPARFSLPEALRELAGQT